VIACENGLSARDELLKNENEFDLILLDLLMPEMTGLDLLKIIKTYIF
jgi:NIMA (never in mitosis gene a)-related kinase